MKNWFEDIILVALLRSNGCLLGDPLVLLHEVVHLVLHQLVRRHSSVRACCGDTTLSCFTCVLPVLLLPVPCLVLIFPLLLLVSLGFPVLFSLLATFIAILPVVPLSLLSLATSLCLQPLPLVRPSLLVLPLVLVLPFGLVLPLPPGWICLSCLPV